MGPAQQGWEMQACLWRRSPWGGVKGPPLGHHAAWLLPPCCRPPEFSAPRAQGPLCEGCSCLGHPLSPRRVPHYGSGRPAWPRRPACWCPGGNSGAGRFTQSDALMSFDRPTNCHFYGYLQPRHFVNLRTDISLRKPGSQFLTNSWKFKAAPAQGFLCLFWGLDLGLLGAESQDGLSGLKVLQSNGNPSSDHEKSNCPSRV